MEKVLNIILLNIFMRSHPGVVVGRWGALSEALRISCHPKSTWAEVLTCLQRCGFWAEALVLETSLKKTESFAMGRRGPESPGIKSAGEVCFRDEVGATIGRRQEIVSEQETIPSFDIASRSCQVQVSSEAVLGSHLDTFDEHSEVDPGRHHKLRAISAFGVGYPRAWVERLGASAPPVVWALRDESRSISGAQDGQIQDQAPSQAVRASLNRKLVNSGREATPGVAFGAAHKIVSGVGCRQAEPWALDACKDWARLLSEEGFILASGGARGCDHAFVEGVLSGRDTNLVKDGRRSRTGFAPGGSAPGIARCKSSYENPERMTPSGGPGQHVPMLSTIEIVPYGFMARPESDLGHRSMADRSDQARVYVVESQGSLSPNGTWDVGRDHRTSSLSLGLALGAEISSREVGEWAILEASRSAQYRAQDLDSGHGIQPWLPISTELPTRQGPLSDHLILSPFPIGTAFSGSNAMIRNRLIYAIGDFTVVFSARFREGGTWGGAVDALRANRIVWVVEPPARASESRKMAFKALIGLGAMAISPWASLEELNRMVEVSKRYERAVTRSGKRQSRLTQSLFAS